MGFMNEISEDVGWHNCLDYIKRNKDIICVHSTGLEEGIRCAMCTNPMKNDRGCDGGCRYDEDMYKRILDVIKSNTMK